LTSYRFQLHLAQKINVFTFRANFTLPPNSITTYPVLREVLTAHANNQTVWSNNRVSGHAYYWPTKVEIYLVLPSNDTSKLKALAGQFAAFVTSNPGLNVTQSTYVTYPRYMDFLQLTQSIAEEDPPSGIFEVVAGRLIPRPLFEEPEDVQSLVDAVTEGMRLRASIIEEGLTEIIMTTPANHPDGRMTSVNPAWHHALWHLLMTAGWAEELPVHEQSDISHSFLATIDALKEINPGGGCYLNEGHYPDPEWQEFFWGSNLSSAARG
jgi:hypothetical protein